MSQSDIDQITQKSLDIISIAIALTYKWQKIDLVDQLESWVKKFSESMSEEEKKEYLEVVKKLNLV